MEYSLEKNVSISSGRMFASDSVSLPRLDNPTGACPTHRRQWADFLVSLMAPLHRHRLRAVMFRGANKGHTQKSYKLSSGMRT